MSEPLLRVTDLKKHFSVKGGLLSREVARVHAVDGVSFAVNRGETLGLVGESGCGKPTNGRLVLRLIERTSGEVLFEDTDISTLSGDDLIRFRQRAQIVFQDPYASLNPRKNIERAIGDYVERIRSNRLNLSDLEGGTFTITNGGVYGSLLSTPILNPPQSAILGMHAIQERPVARDGEVVVRPMMYLALSYDHRLIDGKEAVQFLKRIKEYIEEPEEMLLEL